jgi:lipopolysaccharide heptosyltransferase II
MNNILVININWLGDAVFSTPVFKALKDNYPQARIVCLCPPSVKRVLEFCPWVDEIIILDERKTHFWPWAKWSLIRQLRNRRFDAAFLLHRSASRAMIALLAGIPLRIGYCKKEWLLTHPVEFNHEGIHRSDVYLKVVEGYGLKVKDRFCQLTLKAQDSKELNELLWLKGIENYESIIVLHTGGNWELKRWPAPLFSYLIQCISERFKAKVVLSGAQGDREYCLAINEQAGRKGIVVAGETSLGESLALYKRAKVVVSSDSGPLHLAHSVGANVIGIFGPTRSEITGPRGIGKAEILFNDVGCNKAPCYHLSCSNNVCMQSVTVEDVLQTIQKFVS